MTSRDAGQWALAGFLAAAGTMHLIVPAPFSAQVPRWMPMPAVVIAVSGVIEILLAAALVTLRRYRRAVGIVTAAFFVAIVPGNLAQALDGIDAFGLTTDTARWARLALQPVFVLWALWCAGVWPPPWRSRSRSGPTATER